jgi:hypothetical protein
VRSNISLSAQPISDLLHKDIEVEMFAAITISRQYPGMRLLPGAVVLPCLDAYVILKPTMLMYNEGIIYHAEQNGQDLICMEFQNPSVVNLNTPITLIKLKQTKFLCIDLNPDLSGKLINTVNIGSFESISLKESIITVKDSLGDLNYFRSKYPGSDLSG